MIGSASSSLMDDCSIIRVLLVHIIYTLRNHIVVIYMYQVALLLFLTIIAIIINNVFDLEILICITL